MGEDIRGYESIDIVRLDAGSPNSWYGFNARGDSVMIDVIGSPGVYFNFNEGATTGSTSGFVSDGSFRVFDIKAGSVSIYSVTGSPSVQVINLRNIA